MSIRPAINNVLIIAGDADGNLGDRAILYATCDELIAVQPELRITAISDTQAIQNADLGIETIPSGIRGFIRLLQAAVHADIIICGGGGLFQDDDSLIKMPYWAMRVLTMRLCCRRIIGYSLGVGPLSAPTSRWSARVAFSCMRYISARDPVAQATAQACTSKSVTVVPDAALLLEAESASKAQQWLAEQGVPTNGRPLIGVAVRRWFPPKPRLIPNRIAARFRPPDADAVQSSTRLCRLLATTLDRLVSENGAYVLFLPTYNVSHESDDQLCREIQRYMATDPGMVLRIDDPRLYKGVCGLLEVLLGGRMHPTILAATVGTPVVGLAYNPKFRGFFSMLGLDQYIIDVQDFVNQELTDPLTDLVNAAIRHPPDVATNVAEISERIRRFNREILGAET